MCIRPYEAAKGEWDVLELPVWRDAGPSLNQRVKCGCLYSEWARGRCTSPPGGLHGGLLSSDVLGGLSHALSLRQWWRSRVPWVLWQEIGLDRIVPLNCRHRKQCPQGSRIHRPQHVLMPQTTGHRDWQGPIGVTVGVYRWSLLGQWTSGVGSLLS